MERNNQLALVILIVVFLVNLYFERKEKPWKLKYIIFLKPDLFVMWLEIVVLLLFADIIELSYEREENLIMFFLMFFTALEFIMLILVYQNNKDLIKINDKKEDIIYQIYQIVLILCFILLLCSKMNILQTLSDLINSKENILYSFYVYILFNAGVFLYFYLLFFLSIKMLKNPKIVFMNKWIKIVISFVIFGSFVRYLINHYVDIFLESRFLNLNYLYIFVFGLAIIIIGILMFSQFIDNIMKEFYLFLNRSSQKLILKNIFKISSILSVIISVVFYKAIVGEGVISDLVNLLSSCIIIPLLLEGVISEKEKSLNEDN